MERRACVEMIWWWSLLNFGEDVMVRVVVGVMDDFCVVMVGLG